MQVNSMLQVKDYLIEVFQKRQKIVDIRFRVPFHAVSLIPNRR